MHHTLMQPGSPLFNTASGLKVGQKVKFSGTFFKGVSGDCLYESSLRLQSKVEDPEFIFRFSSITPMGLRMRTLGGEPGFGRVFHCGARAYGALIRAQPVRFKPRRRPSPHASREA